MEKQRWERTCKCGNTFKTHSSNRTDCYSCKPKCHEKHYFKQQEQPGEVIFVKHEEKNHGRSQETT